MQPSPVEAKVKWYLLNRAAPTNMPQSAPVSAACDQGTTSVSPQTAGTSPQKGAAPGGTQLSSQLPQVAPALLFLLFIFCLAVSCLDASEMQKMMYF